MSGSPARVLVGAYAASPAHTRWDPLLEAELLAALFALPSVRGFELPWLGAVHPHDPRWLLDHVPRGAQVALTPLPWVMRRSAQSPAYGLASVDPEGRAAAVADLRRVNDDVGLLAGESDAEPALVLLHSAPRRRADASALARSLDELARWDWKGARLVVEHCDAVRPGRAFEKGFLPIDEELAVIGRADGDVGLWMNWGRSAIELRDSDAVTAQIRDASATGRLVGLSFSGASSHDGPYGPAWTDSHPPIRSTDPSSHSVLDDAHVAAAVAAAPGVPWLGVKVARRPDDVTAAEVAATVRRNLDIVRGASR
ncbi:DUF4862 family protein [Microbacterium sp. NPDC056569]|uniref:DUF4862 family protein n=1 Tax=Microbacterium sp. NPDC056569 TaxID=3345867 RepID=UPI003670DF0E